MSDPIPAEFERSLRKAPQRRRVFLLLNSLGETTVGQLARMTGLPWTRVLWILEGRPPQYSVADSLVGAGMASIRRKGRAYIVAITSAGRRKARSILAHERREVARREAVRAIVREPVPMPTVGPGS